MNFKSPYFILFLLLCSCYNPSNQVTQDGIKRDTPIQDGFDLIEIFVSEFNDNGRPTKYTDGASVFCGPTKRFSGYLGKSVYNLEEKNLISYHRKKMDTIMALNGNSIGGAGHDYRIMEYIKSKKCIDSILNANFPFKAQKEIPFFQKNDNYKWVFTKEGVAKLKFYDYSKKVFDTLPMKIKKSQWYLLNFSNASNIIDKVFFKINGNGEIEQHNHYKVLMGV